ncbi:putative histone deacetylase family protein [Pelagophyceae sp. CCMP2097]|nr:putative histone deacetylase family protein [Pelagophyceae sp. CCMP2097]
MVSHAGYSIPWPQNHRFPMWKFDDLRAAAVEAGLVETNEFFSPDDGAALDVALARAHGADYLAGVMDNTLPDALWRRIGFTQRPDHGALMRRTRLECAGTLLAARLAQEHGMACNLGGGTHHAHHDAGAGYTIINDLAAAALDHLAKTLANRALVIDLDVHQGDGTAEILRSEERAFTLSVHCGDNYPFGFNKKAAPYLGDDRSDLDVALPGGAGDEECLAALREHVPRVLDTFRPSLVIYDAGVDAHADDALGRLQLSSEGLLKRDLFILQECVDRGIPVATVIGGGYDSNRDRLAARHLVVLQAATQVWRQRHH